MPLLQSAYCLFTHVGVFFTKLKFCFLYQLTQPLSKISFCWVLRGCVSPEHCEDVGRRLALRSKSKLFIFKKWPQLCRFTKSIKSSAEKHHTDTIFELIKSRSQEQTIPCAGIVKESQKVWRISNCNHSKAELAEPERPWMAPQDFPRFNWLVVLAALPWSLIWQGLGGWPWPRCSVAQGNLSKIGKPNSYDCVPHCMELDSGGNGVRKISRIGLPW